jgi:hypothetical protein
MCRAVVGVNMSAMATAFPAAMSCGMTCQSQFDSTRGVLADASHVAPPAFRHFGSGRELTSYNPVHQQVCPLFGLIDIFIPDWHAASLSKVQVVGIGGGYVQTFAPTCGGVDCQLEGEYIVAFYVIRSR